MPSAQRDAASRAICNRLNDHLADLHEVARRDARERQQVAAYAALPSEVDLRPLVRDLLRRGARVAFPRVAKDRDLHFAHVASLDELRPGAFGVDEPHGDAIDLASLDAVLVPGVAFDRRGARIGFGGGYYDRALAAIRAANPDAIFIGVAFCTQLVEEVPIEPWDILMDQIVTERDGWNSGDVASR